jgi:hypothetical protein
MMKYRAWINGASSHPREAKHPDSRSEFPTPGLVLWEIGLILATVLGFAVLIDLVLSAAGLVPG